MIEIQGLQSFDRMSRALQKAATQDLSRELSNAALAALKPLPNDIDQRIDQTLPRHGGLADRIKRSTKQVIRLRGGARFSLKGRRAFQQLDRGILRHPLFGNAQHWYQQRVPPGFWAKPTAAASLRAEREVGAALQRVANKVERAQ